MIISIKREKLLIQSEPAKRKRGRPPKNAPAPEAVVHTKKRARIGTAMPFYQEPSKAPPSMSLGQRYRPKAKKTGIRPNPRTVDA